MKYWPSHISLAIQIGIILGALIGSFFSIQSIWILATIPFVVIMNTIYQDIRLWYMIAGLITMIGMGYWVNISLDEYDQIQTSIPSQLRNIEGIIRSQPKTQPFGFQYRVYIPEYQAQVFMTIPDKSLIYGQAITIQSGKSSIPDNPGIRRFLLGRQIHRYITVSQYELISSQCNMWCHSMRLVYQMKNWILFRIDISYPGKVGEFLKGILIGYTDTLPTEIKESFRVTGVSHILAVSGYNMSIIIILVYQQLINRQIRREISFGITILCMIGFILLTGGEASIMRAGIFAGIILLAEQLQNYVGGLRPLILCAALLTLYNPLYIGYDIGFQLSFLAVLGLMAYGHSIQSYTQGIPSLGIIPMIGETVFAQILVLPLLLYYFGEISIISIIANLAVVPFLPLAMMWGSITSLIGPFRILTYPLSIGIDGLLSLNRYLSTLEWASFTIEPISTLTLMLLYIAMIGIWSIYYQFKKL